MHLPTMTQFSRVFLPMAAVIAITVLSACSSIGTSNEAGVDAPTYAVGDRWVYAAHDGFFRTVTRWEESREVVAISPGNITVRITQKGPAVDAVRIEHWSAPGMVRVGALFDSETRRFAEPLKRYDFPLVPGKSWNQNLAQFNEAVGKAGEINRYVRVGGWEKVTTPAGTFNSIRMRVFMWLDDATNWRHATNCSYVLFYSPAVHGMVREEKEAEYLEAGLAPALHRSQHAVLDLTSFTPGAP
jgi:uncharacterized protein YceK